uniref:Uncharacterized protein n=1 Tax=Timema tahoe TaxID=61484 RepID=A0A7R9NZT9_9NEOP|nr:unnamed protein product [Timema tahoe]
MGLMSIRLSCVGRLIKVELYMTGGGTFTKQLNDEGAKLMALLKPQFVPLVNLSDSDAGYHFELPGEEQVEKQSEECLVNPTHSTIIENPVVSCPVASAIYGFHDLSVLVGAKGYFETWFRIRTLKETFKSVPLNQADGNLEHHALVLCKGVHCPKISSPDDMEQFAPSVKYGDEF